MSDRTAFRILPKDTALFPEVAAPRQRTFLPPADGQMGDFPTPLDHPTTEDDTLPIDKFLAKEKD